MAAVGAAHVVNHHPANPAGVTVPVGITREMQRVANLVIRKLVNHGFASLGSREQTIRSSVQAEYNHYSNFINHGIRPHVNGISSDCLNLKQYCKVSVADISKYARFSGYTIYWRKGYPDAIYEYNKHTKQPGQLSLVHTFCKTVPVRGNGSYNLRSRN
jgi:hypothetical protein